MTEFPRPLPVVIMVLLTMTASIVEALKSLDESIVDPTAETSSNEKEACDEPSVKEAVVGNPISHDQIIGIWKKMGARGGKEHSLEGLLRGAAVYIPPPPPKPEPSNEYKALMARLRREEEERTYERMLKAPQSRETFAQRFPMAAMSQADSYVEANKPFRQSDIGEDRIAHGEVQNQVSLIVNFLVSIIGCAGAIWIVAQWWSTTARLFLTLGGSIIVAVAEVAVYSAYSWRMDEGAKKQQGMKEVREVVKTWVVGDGDDPKTGHDAVLIQPKAHDTDASLRKRVFAQP